MSIEVGRRHQLIALTSSTTSSSYSSTLKRKDDGCNSALNRNGGGPRGNLALSVRKLSTPALPSPGDIPYSPITDLAHNLGETLHCYGKTPTPKRRLSLSSTPGSTESTPTFDIKPMALEKQFSIDDGCCLDSPSPVEESPSIQERFNLLARKQSNERSPLDIKSAAYRRFQSMPVPFCGFDASPSGEDRLSEEETSPEKPNFSLLEDENSQDSGVGLEKDKDAEAEFLLPTGPAPRRARPLNDETNSPRHFSPKQFSVQRQQSSPATLLHFPGASVLASEHHSSPSPVKLRRSSLTHSDEADEGDDGFLELLDSDEKHDEEKAPAGLQGLFSAPVINRDCNESTPNKKRVVSRVCFQEDAKPRIVGCSRRGLFRSPSMPSGSAFDMGTRSIAQKRTEPCQEEQDDSTPRQFKRRRSVIEESPVALPQPKPVTPKLYRSYSEAAIKTALNRGEEQPDLIGDFSKSYVLPLIPGKHSDLKSISCRTMADLLNGEYKDKVANFTIVDCRYPYEFNGGHIRGAINPYTKDQVLEDFIKSDKFRQPPSSPHQRNIIIFHCEFSSERGPRMCRFLRNVDRDSNKQCYPSLYYPEIYILHDGYKAFFENYKELCDPNTYRPMLHEDYNKDLKHFRAKSKSWAGERSRMSSCRTGLKL